MTEAEFRAAYIEPPAQEMATRPLAERGGSVVMLMTEIDSALRTRFPEWTDGQRGGVVLQLTTDILGRAFEIERETALRAGGNRPRRAVQGVLL